MTTSTDPLLTEASLTDSSLTELTFGQWVHKTREKNNLTLKQCAQRAGMKWQAWQRLESDEPKRRDGSLPKPTRATVVKLADALQTSRAQALHAANYPVNEAEDETGLISIQVLYDDLGPEDREDLLHLALLKWQRKNPAVSPYSLAATAQPEQAVGEFLCLNLQTGKLLSAGGVQAIAPKEEQKERLLEVILRLLTWQEDRTERAQEITQDLNEIRQLLDGHEAVADLARGPGQMNLTVFNRILE